MRIIFLLEENNFNMKKIHDFSSNIIKDYKSFDIDEVEVVVSENLTFQFSLDTIN